MRESGENYLELILEIEEEATIVKSIEIAKRAGVSRASVSKAIKVLKEGGFVEMEHYGTVFLTESGRQKATAVKEKHGLIKAFLIKTLELDEETASEDACRIEHIVSDKFMEKLKIYLK